MIEKEHSKQLLIFAMAGDLDGVKQLAEAGACINCYNKASLIIISIINSWLILYSSLSLASSIALSKESKLLQPILK